MGAESKIKSEVYLIDCMEYMKNIPDKYFDVCITDPPYGVDLKYNSFKDSKENTTAFIKLFMPEILRVSKRTVITSGVKLMYKYPEPDWVGNWYNPAGIGVGSHGFCCWQPILIYGKDPNSGRGSLPDSFEWTGACDSDSLFHPVPKPIKVWRKIMARWINEKDHLIFDPFMGSQTTRIICYDGGFDFVGCELDPDYFRDGCKRFENHIKQQRFEFS